VPWSAEVGVLAAIKIALLVEVVAVEVAVALAGLVAFLGHGALTGLTGRRAARRLEKGRIALQSALEEGQGGNGAGPNNAVDAGVRHLAELPRRLRIDLLADVAFSLAGAKRRRLATLAVELGLSAVADGRCRSRLWWRRLQGARLFTLLGGGKATVPRLLGDRRPEVRTQAAQWAVEHHDQETVGLLLRMLELDDGSTRFTVKDSLIRIGRPLTPLLAAHLREHSGASVGPVLAVAVGLPDPVLLPAALALCADDVPGIRALAARLAGAIGGGRAVEVLLDLTGDEAPEVRAAAARALGRAGHWPAAPSLARLLNDASWDVRHQAAVALRTLGPPGMLFLGRAVSAGDPAAADAARHMLDLPDSAMRTL